MNSTFSGVRLLKEIDALNREKIHKQVPNEPAEAGPKHQRRVGFLREWSSEIDSLIAAARLIGGVVERRHRRLGNDGFGSRAAFPNAFAPRPVYPRKLSIAAAPHFGSTGPLAGIIPHGSDDNAITAGITWDIRGRTRDGAGSQ